MILSFFLIEWIETNVIESGINGSKFFPMFAHITETTFSDFACLCYKVSRHRVKTPIAIAHFNVRMIGLNDIGITHGRNPAIAIGGWKKLPIAQHVSG